MDETRLSNSWVNSGTRYAVKNCFSSSPNGYESQDLSCGEIYNH